MIKCVDPIIINLTFPKIDGDFPEIIRSRILDIEKVIEKSLTKTVWKYQDLKLITDKVVEIEEFKDELIAIIGLLNKYNISRENVNVVIEEKSNFWKTQRTGFLQITQDIILFLLMDMNGIVERKSFKIHDY